MEEEKNESSEELSSVPDKFSPRKTFKLHPPANCLLVLSPIITMKRKLDANDIPSPEAADKSTEDADELTFENLNLDSRLRQALIKENFTRPTLVQSKAIPLALEGKDILGMPPLVSHEKSED